ncbi:ATP-binding protein [Thermodesulfobacteriota bacterium]
MRHKFYYIISLLALVVFLFITVVAFFIHKDTEEKINTQFAKTELIMAKFVAAELSSGVERLVEELESITANPDSIKMDISNIPYFVKNNLNEVVRLGLTHNLIFVSDRGDIVYSYPLVTDNDDLLNDYDFSLLKNKKEQLSDGKPVLSDIYNRKSEKGRVATLFVPLLSSDIEFKGAIGILINFDVIRKRYFDNIDTLRSFELTILNEEGAYLESACKKLNVIQTFGKVDSCTYESKEPEVVAFTKRVLTEGSGVGSFKLKSQLHNSKITYIKKFAAFYEINLANRSWHIVISIPYEEITFLIQKNFQYIAIIITITFLLILGCSIVLFEINKRRLRAEDSERHLRQESTLKDKLTFSEEKYKLVMDEAFEGIAIFRGVELIEVNSAWALTFDTTIGECIGNTIYDFVQKDSIDLVKELFEKDYYSSSDEEDHHYDIEISSSRGKRKTLNISMSKLETTNNISCIVSRDVTDKRDEELEISESKRKLEKANKELDFYISSIVHDIKNPLVAVQGFINILTNEFCGPDDKSGNKEKYIEKIYSNISHIFDLLSSLLELSKIGRVKKNIERVDANKELNMVKGHLSSSLEESNASITINNTLPIVYTDRTLLKQIFENLISNAIKFSRKDALPQIEIGSTMKEDFICFYVRDNGIGIDEKDIDTVFKVFGRVNPRVPGNGVGMNIVKKAVAELGGEIECLSEKGVGTTFSFSLPKRKTFLYLQGLKSDKSETSGDESGDV